LGFQKKETNQQYMSIHRDTRGKSPFWYACFTLPNGKRTTRSTKQTEKRKAEAVARELQKAARQARDGNLQEFAARKVIGDLYEISNGEPLPSSKIRSYFESWLARKKLETAPATYRKYADVVRQLLAFFGLRSEQDIARLSSQDILNFRQQEANRVSPSSTNHALKIVKSALRDAFRAGLINTNPAERVSPIKRAKAEIERRPFSQQEISRLLDVAKGSEWEGLIYFGYYTGQRLGDLAALTWRNIDVIRKEIAFSTRKTGRRQILPMADTLLDFVENMSAGENPAQPLFPRAFNKLASAGRTGSLSNQFYNLMVEAGIVEPRPHRSRGIGRSSQRKLSEVSFHCLRHTTTSVLKNNGATSAVTQEIVGHDSPAISQIYTHIDTETLRKAVNSMPKLEKI
jgi:integrase